MKQCKQCGQEKQLTEYYKANRNTDGLNGRCKECVKGYAREYIHQQYYNNPEKYKEYQKSNHKRHIQNLTLPYHIVYLLPDHNYVGVTNKPYFRMINHRSEHNRNTDNWTELKRFNTRKEALIYESQLHSQGYVGAK